MTAFKADASPVKSGWVHRTDSEQQIEVSIGRLQVRFFFQAEDGIRDRSPSRGLGDVYKRQLKSWENYSLKIELLCRKKKIQYFNTFSN